MRADKFFSEKYGSRTKAAEAIERGLILVNGKTIKAKTEISITDTITFIEAEESFVSNGGYKLARALKHFSFDCRNKIFVDIGASTGGFTDCLLQNGANKVYAIDVGESLLHKKLQNDNRIVVMDNTNARYLTRENFTDTIDCIVTDVSFISLRHIFPVIKAILEDYGCAFVLIKPQFECENKSIGKRGIVSPTKHPQIVEKVLNYAMENQLYPQGIINAPIKKGKNIEYILFCSLKKEGSLSILNIVTEVKNIVRHSSGAIQ